MIPEIKEAVEYKELNGVSEMIEGCNQAIVTHVLTDDMKLHKIVTFYNSRLFNFEQINVGHSCMVNQNYRVSIFRHFMYVVRDGIFKSYSGLKFFAIWIKDIAGYVPDPENTHDCRTNKRY